MEPIPDATPNTAEITTEDNGSDSDAHNMTIDEIGLSDSESSDDDDDNDDATGGDGVLRDSILAI